MVLNIFLQRFRFRTPLYLIFEQEFCFQFCFFKRNSFILLQSFSRKCHCIGIFNSLIPNFVDKKSNHFSMVVRPRREFFMFTFFYYRHCTMLDIPCLIYQADKCRQLYRRCLSEKTIFVCFLFSLQHALLSFS